MERYSDCLPIKEGEFFVYQKNLISGIEAIAGKIGVETGATPGGGGGIEPPFERLAARSYSFPELKVLQGTFEAKYILATDPATRTPGVVAAKNVAMKAYKAAIRSFLKEHITYNPTVTEEERINMGAPVHKTGRTPAPVPTTAPEADVRIPAPGIVEIHYRNAESKNIRKPAGVHGCELKWTVSDSMVSSWEQLNHSEFDTHSPLRLSFDGTDRGRRLWFALRWENTRGDKGPWSEIQEAVIP